MGFLPGGSRGQVAAALAEHEQSRAQGRSVLGVLRGPDRRLLGFGWWERNGGRPDDRDQVHMVRRVDGGPLVVDGRP